MTQRKLSVQPKRRRDVSGFAATAPPPATEPPAVEATAAAPPQRRSAQRASSAAPSRSRRKASPAPRPDAPRRRVHVTVTRAAAAALRERVAHGDMSNTQVLITAYTDCHARVARSSEPESPFAPRRNSDAREGVYFYLAPGEIDHLDTAAWSAGFENRSQYISELLAAYLLAD